MKKTFLHNSDCSDTLVNKLKTLKKSKQHKLKLLDNVLSDNNVENIVLFFTMSDESQNGLCILREHI